VTARLASWRSVTLEQADQRQALREACPAEKHGDAAVDLDAARRILGDHALYVRAISASNHSPTGLQHAAYESR